MGGRGFLPDVALYLDSTSNHNSDIMLAGQQSVALYLDSTSNHNNDQQKLAIDNVALYLDSTSNHNLVKSMISAP